MSHFRTGHQAAIINGLSVLDIDHIPAEDQLAFATGYITGKIGNPKDPMSAYVPMPDYDAGWEVGAAVFNGTGPRPEWDRGHSPN